MLSERRVVWRQPVFVSAVVVLVAAVTVVAVRAARSDTTAHPATALAADGSRLPQARAEDAVKALLEAEQRGDHDTSFHYLSPASLETYPDAVSWAKRRTEVPEVTAFSVQSVDGATITTGVAHKPGLDPFVGLSASHETERWHTVRAAGGWLVDADPEVALDLPPAARAADTALRWAKAVQGCDKQRADALQVEPDLLGALDGPHGLCKTPGTLAVTAAQPVPPGPDSADLVAQYGEAAFTWARSVQVTGAAGPFSVILAPIGDDWRVLGTAQA